MGSENMSTSLLIADYITTCLSPLIVGNRGRWTRSWRQFLDQKPY